MPDEARELKPMTFFNGGERATAQDGLTKDWTPKVERLDQPEVEVDIEERRASTLHEGTPDDEDVKGGDDPSPQAPDEEPNKGDGDEIPEIPDSPDLPNAQGHKTS